MAKFKIKTRKAGKVAYIEHTGEFRKIPYEEYYKELYGWAKEKKAKPGMKPIGIFLDDPHRVSAAECRSQIGVPIFGDVEGGDRIKVKEIPEMQVAVMKFSGEASEYEEAYRTLGLWIKEQGYRWSGPSIEVYGKTKEKKDVTILKAEIQAPIEKKE